MSMPKSINTVRLSIFTLESHLGFFSLGSIVNTICGFRIKLPEP